MKFNKGLFNEDMQVLVRYVIYFCICLVISLAYFLVIMIIVGEEIVSAGGMSCALFILAFLFSFLTVLLGHSSFERWFT